MAARPDNPFMDLEWDFLSSCLEGESHALATASSLVRRRQQSPVYSGSVGVKQYPNLQPSRPQFFPDYREKAKAAPPSYRSSCPGFGKVDRTFQKGARDG